MLVTKERLHGCYGHKSGSAACTQVFANLYIAGTWKVSRHETKIVYVFLLPGCRPELDCCARNGSA